MPQKPSLDWKTYESITRYIYESLGIKLNVKVVGHGSDFWVTGKSGVKHQIDILTSHSDGIHDYKTAIECKYWKEKITKDTVMKVSQILEDAGIQKGVIVSKSGFTKDAVKFAESKSIGLVELREASNKDQHLTQPKHFIGELVINHKVFVYRPIVLNTLVEYSNKEHDQKETLNIYATSIRLEDGKLKSLSGYITTFQQELQRQKRVDQPITMRYEIPGGLLVYKSDAPVPIEGIVFSGVLKYLDLSSTHTYSIVDEVWLTMKAIFEEKSFSITENGIIVENKM